MPSVALLLGATKRSLSPEAVLLNCYAEPAPTQQTNPQAIRARAGLTAFKTVGGSRARCLFMKSGLFDDRALIVSDGTAYLLSTGGVLTTLGGVTLAGSGFLDVDGGQDADLNSVARAATGSALYKITEADGVVLEDFPAVGGAGASSVCYHRGFWFATEAGTDQVYYQIPGDTAWTALSFASAEYAPDKLTFVRSRGDQIVLGGDETTEVWTLTGSASPAIAPYGGLNFDFGCRALATSVNVSGTLVWVDNRCNVRAFSGGNVDLISDNGLSEQIAGIDAGDLSASGYQIGGHTFYVLTLGGEATWVYDLSTQKWHRRNTLGFDYCQDHMYATLGDTVFAASSVSNQISVVDPSARTDLGTVFPVEFMAYAEVLEGQVPCANVELICENGVAPLSGQGSAPIIQMRVSDDGGHEWSRWYEQSLGSTGQYRKRVRWSGLGTVRAPYGRWFHFRASDPVGRRYSDVRMNAV